MAEESRDEGGGSWWSCFYETAKAKSSEALEFMKRDLTELSQSVQNVQQDAVAAVSSTTAAVSTTAAILKDKLRVDVPNSVANKAKQGISTFINTLSEVFLPMREENNDEIFVICNSQPILLDRWQTQLHAIRTDPNTYCHEPEGPPELYEAWLETFNIESHREEISEIMIHCKDVRQLHAKLVPAAVSQVEFWQRYYYRVHLLKEAEAKRSELMRRTEMRSPDDISWDDDDDFDENFQYSPSKKIKSQKEELGQDSLEILLPQTGATVLHESKSQDKSEVDCSNESLVTKHSVKQDHSSSENQIDQRLSSENFRVEENKVQVEVCGANSSNKSNSSNILASDETKFNMTLSKFSEEQSSDKVYVALQGLVSKEKGDMVVVGSKNSNSISPASSDTALKDTSMEDDWEKDFDLIINEDLKTHGNIERISKKSIAEGDEDWEKWE